MELKERKIATTIEFTTNFTQLLEINFSSGCGASDIRMSAPACISVSRCPYTSYQASDRLAEYKKWLESQQKQKQKVLQEHIKLKPTFFCKGLK